MGACRLDVLLIPSLVTDPTMISDPVFCFFPKTIAPAKESPSGECALFSLILSSRNSSTRRWVQLCERPHSTADSTLDAPPRDVAFAPPLIYLSHTQQRPLKRFPNKKPTTASLPQIEAMDLTTQVFKVHGTCGSRSSPPSKLLRKFDMVSFIAGQKPRGHHS